MKRFSLTLILLAFFIGCQSEKFNQTNLNSSEPLKDEIAELTRLKEAVRPFFKPMGEPEAGDWLASFQESGQTFEEYINGKPTLTTSERRVIYIQPAGDFTETQKKVIGLTADYIGRFYNLPVKLNSEIKLDKLPKEVKRKNPFSRQEQIKTGYFLAHLLPEILPQDAAALICFTSYDLYPDENWNFVFGQASLNERVGVWSLYRFGEPDKSEEDYRLFLTRTLKVAMHETGHMFSMMHCTKYECVMSGSNHLEETDRHPLDACPECASKIAWAMNYQLAERYKLLAEFWEQQKIDEEKQTYLKKAEAVEAFNKVFEQQGLEFRKNF